MYKLLSLFVLVALITASSPGCKVTQGEYADLAPGTKLPYNTAVVPDTMSFYELLSELSDFNAPEWFTDYESILEEYKRFVDYSIEGGAEQVIRNHVFSTPESGLGYHWSYMVIEANIWSYRDFPKDRDAFGYALKDLNGNGNPELILLLKDYTVLAIISTTDGKAKVLDAYWPRYECAICESGLLYTHSSGGATDWMNTLSQISSDDSKLLPIKAGGLSTDIGWYKVVDGKEYGISKSDFSRFREEYPAMPYGDAREITKNSRIEFIPVFG